MQSAGDAATDVDWGYSIINNEACAITKTVEYMNLDIVNSPWTTTAPTDCTNCARSDPNTSTFRWNMDAYDL